MNMKTKKMILLTNSFPFDKGETYLETEVNYYEKFDFVDIFALSVRRNKGKREINGNNIEVYPIFFASKWVYIINSLRVLGDKNFYQELFKLLREKRLTVKRFIRLIVFITRARYEASLIMKNYKNKKNVVTENGIIYSYRFEYQIYVALLLKKYFPNYKLVARGHRYDLYEYANTEDYIPLREKILDSVDSMICIAEDGKRYLENKFPKHKEKIFVSRLGTLNHNIKKVTKKSGELKLVSCSNVVKVKRIEKIIEALSLLNDIQVHWTHYGDGVLLNEMIQLAKEKLPKNISVDFKGFKANKQVLYDYSKEEYHIFINVSESEGIPVSIMESLSFGIPVIATNVGGTDEIIEDGYNGVLIDKNFDIVELKNWILKFTNMNFKEYQMYRDNARVSWEKSYDANENYSEFIKYLHNLSD